MTKARSGRSDSRSNDDRSIEQQTSEGSNQRHRMIEEAAYYRAQQRNFQEGDPMRDWLEAEREINRLIPSPLQQKEELLAYQKLRQRVQSIFKDVHDTLPANTVRET